jgi:hypothetical protein
MAIEHWRNNGKYGLVAHFCAALALGACAPEVTTVGEWSPPRIWTFEAEDGELSGGFVVRKDASASRAAYLAPPDLTPADLAAEDAPGEARARYLFSLPDAGEFELWGRIQSPGAGSNRFWFQLDDGTWYKWRISVGDIWYWDDLHDDTDYGKPLLFELAAGEHELILANCVPGVGLDKLRVSAADESPPDNDTRCKPPHSIELDGQCLPSCGSQSGTMCGASACEGKSLLQAYDCAICCKDEP